MSEQGKEAVVAVLGPDEFCGEGCLAGQPRRMATAAAMMECEILRLEKAAMIRVLHEEPAFSELFVSHLLARTIRVEEDLVDQLFNSSEKRLARALLLLANFGKEGRPEPVVAKVSQETLAEMIGTTRSRVSHFMNKFPAIGLHRLQRNLGSPQLVVERRFARSTADQKMNMGTFEQSGVRWFIDCGACGLRRPTLCGLGLVGERCSILLRQRVVSPLTLSATRHHSRGRAVRPAPQRMTLAARTIEIMLCQSEPSCSSFW